MAAQYRKMAKQGIDPIKTRSQQRREALRPKSNLFVIAEAAYEAKKAELKNDGINARWFSPLQLHVLPKLGSVSVEEITQQDIAQTLKPIWETKAETAKKGHKSIKYCFHLCSGSWVGYRLERNCEGEGTARKAT